MTGLDRSMGAIPAAYGEPPAGVGSIVADRTFILATRESGYRDVSAAVSELIDNSLQAGARRVDVLVDESRNQDRRELTIAVLDDGHGMSPENLQAALQFGGSERFGDRMGLGRFGMGLPNSSVSQARRVEVYTWRSPGAFFHSYLDVDEVAAGLLTRIPAPVAKAPPRWLNPPRDSSGTVVLWTGCDRLGRYRTETVVERLRTQLARTYRYPLWSGLRINVNSLPITATDPLFLDSRTSLHGAALYGAPLRYEIAGSGGGSSVVDVRFSELPVEAWHAWSATAKRRAGIVGSASVSVVRAGREIDCGWHLMGGKRRENYDDWWRCEIRFSPQLDELFGVTHNKQGITPSPELRSILAPDLEAIARTLNARVRARFETLKGEATSPAVQTASDVDRFLPPPLNRRCVSAHGLNYRIRSAPLPSPEFFDVHLDGKAVVLTLNSDHPFYTRGYRGAPEPVEAGARQKYVIECLLLAVARAELEVGGGHRDVIARFRRSWSDALAAFLDS